MWSDSSAIKIDVSIKGRNQTLAQTLVLNRKKKKRKRNSKQTTPAATAITKQKKSSRNLDKRIDIEKTETGRQEVDYNATVQTKKCQDDGKHQKLEGGGKIPP